MISDAQIAVLCDIGQSASFDADKQDRVRQLISEGYVREKGDIYELTPKGQKILTDRGAGLNES
jgi:predicted transcriptional regulator